MDKKIGAILMERGLTSHMNDTKWRELCAAIAELPFPPVYQVKTLDEAEPYPDTLEPSSSYGGDWGRTYEAALGVHIEWIRVTPRYKRTIGRLLEPVIDDCSDELRVLLRRLNIPFVESDGFFTIYGHAAGIDFDRDQDADPLRS
jgi:hypothetical protein